MFCPVLRNTSLALALLLPLAAHAAGTRTHVSNSGSDANTAFSCDYAHPCRTFTAALTQTNPGGEILAIDSSGYGKVVIDRSVSIIAAPGVYAGIGVGAGNGVTIATAGVSVVLRGLTITGQGGDNGIAMTNGSTLTVDRCVISNFASGNGLDLNTAATVALLDTLMSGNNRGAFFRGGARATISRSRFLNNGYGLYLSGPGNTKASFSQSEASANTQSGISVNSTPGTSAFLEIRDSVMSGNTEAGLDIIASGGTTQGSIVNSLVSGNIYGLRAAGSGATLVAGGNTVVRSAIGLVRLSSATFQSAGGNVMSGNDSDVSGLITAATTM